MIGLTDLVEALYYLAITKVSPQANITSSKAQPKLIFIPQEAL